MIHSFSSNQTGLALACALALSVLSGAASAQNTPAKDTAFLHDQRGPVIMSGTGLCWHTGTGPTEPLSVACGGTAPVAETPRPIPPPLAVAPAPPPPARVAQAAPPPPPAPRPVAERLTLDADTLFDFDKAILRPAGRDALDAFVGKLKDVSPETIMAVGHADRFGSDDYNQHLSERRVEAVKNYLVSKGIASNRISASGKGESQPVTKSNECLGAKSAKTIACLQPDRRVVIETIGTRVR